MSCKIKELSKDALLKKGVIDEKSGEILDFSLFERINNDLTTLADEKYNVRAGSEKFMIGEENTEGKFIVDYNDYLFDNLDEAITTFNIDSENIRKSSIRGIKEDLNTLDSLVDENTEPIFTFEEESLSDTARKKIDNKEIPEFNNLEEEVAYNVRKMVDNLESAVNQAKNNKYKSKASQAFQDNMETLMEEMQTANMEQGWQAILLYVGKFQEVLGMVEGLMEKSNKNDDDILETIKGFENFLATFDLVENVDKLIADAKIADLDSATEAEIKAVKTKLNSFYPRYKDLMRDFMALKKRKMIQILADPKFATEVETKFRNKYERDHSKLKLPRSGRQAWIAKKMIEHKKEIDEAREAHARKIVTGITPDMSSYASGLFDSLNTDGKLFNLLVNIVADVRDRIITRVKNFDFVLDDLHTEIKKNMGGMIPSKRFKNVIKKTKAGKAYVRGDVKIEFLDSFSEIYLPLQKQFFEIRNGYLEDGLTMKEIKQKSDYKKIAATYYAWRNENLINVGRGQFMVKDKWKDTLSDLTPTERKVVATYHDTISKTSGMMEDKASLKEEVFHANFYALSSITKDDGERFAEMDAKGYLADKKADLTTIRVDDSQFQTEAEAVDAKNQVMQQLKIHFRGNVKPDQQSYDLLTMMRMEVINGVGYAEKKKAENTVNVLKDISRDKQYAQDSSKGGFLYNIFRRREPLTTKTGESNEYKRINGYIESSFYDQLHKHAPKFAGMDANKLVGAINGTTAFIGMSVNVASGLANITNGFTQLFIESVGGNHLSFKSLLKAEKMYAADLPSIISDWSNPVKKSRTNQILQMFDIFGGFSVTNQSFIKDNMFKSLATTETLSGIQTGGEHMMSSILGMAVLDTLKVMNADGDFMDKNGKVVEKESDAASLLDMLSKRKVTNSKEVPFETFVKSAKDVKPGNIVQYKSFQYEFQGGDSKDPNNWTRPTAKAHAGELFMDPRVSLTKHNLVTDYHKGGKAHINIFIKKKIHDTMGAYDANHQNELYRVWYGKLLMMFKRFLIPGLQARWKGISSSHIDREDLDESQVIYNTALKEYEEGTYVTFARTINASKFISHMFKGQILPALEAVKFSHIKENYNSMTDYERANLRKATTELIITGVILPTLSVMAAAKLEDNEDDEALWFLAYQLRRLTSELAQYRSIDEAWRITTNPIAGTRMIQNATALIGTILTPWDWGDENSKGENKAWNDLRKMTPIWVQLSKEWKASYNFINNQAN